MKKYEKPTITSINIDNNNILIMNSDWEPGGGKPPWTGGGGRPKETQASEDDPFNNDVFNDELFK